MIITYSGMACFKVQVGDKILAFSPIGKDSGIKYTRFSSDIALVSLNDGNYNGVHSVSGGSRELFVVDGPGEYEAGEVYIKGFGVEQAMKLGKKEEKKINTIYSVLFDEINLCHLGALNTAEISPEIIESLGEVDILFVPMTGGSLLTPADANKVVNAIQPKLVIPMHVVDTSFVPVKGSLASFLEEMGAEETKKQDKLTIKKKEMEGKEGEVVILEPQS